MVIPEILQDSVETLKEKIFFAHIEITGISIFFWKMSDSQIINIYHQSIELVERFAQCLLKDCKNKNDVALVKQLGPYITYFNNEIAVNKKRNQIFENYVSMIDSATEKPDCDATIKDLHEEIEKAKKQLKSNEKCEKYVSFMKMISETNLTDDDDNEIKTISEVVSTVDPISKLPIVEPVKNIKCGHSYEKSTMFQLIEQNPKTKCPIPGCNATNFVKKNDLIPDNALKRMLSNISNNSQKKFKSS